MMESSIDYDFIGKEFGKVFDDYNRAMHFHYHFLLKSLDEMLDAAFEEIEKALTETDLTEQQQKTVMEIIKKHI